MDHIDEERRKLAFEQYDKNSNQEKMEKSEGRRSVRIMKRRMRKGKIHNNLGSKGKEVVIHEVTDRVNMGFINVAEVEGRVLAEGVGGCPKTATEGS